MKPFTFCLLLSTFLFSTHVHAQKELTIRYIGNMGILISGEHSSILVDGLHDEYVRNSYLYPGEETLAELIKNEGTSFPKIKAALNTHYHNDHFDTALTNTFLTENKLSVFLASAQATESLDAPASQIMTISTNGYQKQTIRYDDFSITGFYLDHVNPNRNGEVQNIGYIIEIDGVRIFHAGDTNWFDTAFETLALKELEVDIAFLPYWMLLEESGVPKMNNWVNPKQVVALHMYPKYFEGHQKNILRNYPKAKLFLKQNESFSYSKE